MGSRMVRIGVISCSAILAIGAVMPASAAALPVKAPPMRAPPPAVAIWTGCYIGANGGGSWGEKDYLDPLRVPPAPLGSHDVKGWVGGGQVGCDYQTGPWVIGVQGLFDGAGLTGSHLVPGATDVLDTRIRWFGTATARVGFAIENALLYVKGGGAWV